MMYRFFIFLCLLFLQELGAQNMLPSDIAFRRLTTAHGLVQDEVHNIQQDKQGFIWVVTISGLSRYDGRNVTDWKVRDKETLNTMNKGILTSLAIDAQDGFWVGTDHQGIFYYNKQSRNFQRFLNNKNDNPSSFFIYKIIENKNTDIFAATNKGLWRYDIKNKKASILFENTAVTNIKNAYDADNKPILLLTTTNKGVWQYDFKKWVLIQGSERYENINDVYIQYSVNPEKNIPTLVSSRDKVGTVVQGNKNSAQGVGTVVQGNKNSAQGMGTVVQGNKNNAQGVGTVVQGNKNSAQGVGTVVQGNKNNAQEVGTVVQGNKNSAQEVVGKIWIASDNGLYIIENKKVIQKLKIKSKSILEDLEKRVWVGTENGLWCFEGKNEMQYLHQADTKSSLSSNHIIRLFADNQTNIWCATYAGGVSWFSLRNQPIKILKNNDKINYAKNFDFRIENNTLIDKKTGKQYAVKTNIIKDSEYKAVFYKDSEQNYWWAFGNGGLQYFNATTKKTTIYTAKINDTTALQHNTVTGVFEDKQKRLWVRTYGGLHLYNKAKNTFRHLRNIVKNYDETANSTIAHYIDKNGYIWLGKWEGGLEVFDPNQRKYQHFSTAEGLPNNAVPAIQADSNGTIWAATLNGIAKIDPNFIFTHKKTPIKVYSERDGLPTNRLENIKYINASANEDEQLYFKSEDGIAVLYPDRLKENKYAPNASITNIMINGEPYASEIPINELTDITLPYFKNNLNIEMAALSYIQPERNAFRYRLLGFDANWIENGIDNTAKYTNLAPNTYTFEFIPFNNDKISGKTHRFTIRIQPALWQRTDFRIGLFLALLCAALFIIHNRIQRIRKEARLARQLSESELAMLRAQMNPHFIFNCMNTIEAYIMTAQADRASAYTRKFSKLTRAVLENSEKPLIPLEQDIEMLKIYIELEQTRFNNRFKVEYDIPDSVLDAEPNIPPMILQPLVENAILHGLQHRIEPDNYLKISVRINENKHLICIVEDNGIGRQRSEIINKSRYSQKKSLATSITHKRLTLLQEQTNQPTQFTIIDLPQGTQALVRMPLLALQPLQPY